MKTRNKVHIVAAQIWLALAMFAISPNVMAQEAAASDEDKAATEFYPRATQHLPRDKAGATACPVFHGHFYMLAPNHFWPATGALATKRRQC